LYKKKKKDEDYALVSASQTVQPTTTDIRTVDTVNTPQKNLENAENKLNEANKKYEKALSKELKKTGKDYTTKFESPLNKRISFETKEEDQKISKPTPIPIAEANKNLQKELAEQQQALDQWKIANYQNNLDKVQNEKSTLFDKTVGVPIRAVKDLFSPLTTGDDNTIVDEKGNKTFLPSYDELKQQKVREDTKGIGGTLQDVGYNATKILGAGALDLVTGGLGGKSLYWTDMAEDNYKNVKNQGYSNEQAIANTLISTGSEFLTEKLLGGLAGKLTGGEASEVQNIISKSVSKLVSNPTAANIIGSMGSEGLEEFVQEYIGALNNKITLGQDTDIEDLVQDSLYSALIGAGSGGLITGIDAAQAKLTTPNINNQQIQQQSVANETQVAPQTEQISEQVQASPDVIQSSVENNQQNQTSTAKEVQTTAENMQSSTENKRIIGNRDFSSEKYKNLSDSDLEILNNLYDKYKNKAEMTPEEINQMQYLKRKISNIKNPELKTDNTFQDLKSDYGKYYKSSNLEDFNSEILDKAKETIQANKQGKRTKQEWLDVAKNIGMQAENMDSESLKKYAFESFKSASPNQKDNLNRQGQKYVNFGIDEWVNKVYEGAGVGKKIKNRQIEDNKIIDKYSTMNQQEKSRAKMAISYEANREMREAIQGNSFEKTEGGLTEKELKKKVEREKSNYIGKEVIVNGQKAKIIGTPSFGNYPVKLENGEIINVKKDRIEPVQKIEEKQPKETYTYSVNDLTKENILEEKAKDNIITIKNDNLQDNKNLKSEDTGVSIGDKKVQLQIPNNSKPNKLGQYIPKDGFTKSELKDGKIGDSKFYKNATERADFIKDEVRQKIKDDDYVKHYKKITNEESMQEAFNDLNTRGTEAIAEFFNGEKEITSKDTAMGWLLIEQSQQNGDYEFANQVLRKMRSNATKLGQAEQMYNYYARLTPEGMYRWCGDQLLRAEEIFEKGKTKKWIEQNKDRWQLNGDEVEFINNQMARIQELNKMNDNETTTIDIKGKPKQVTVDRAKQVEIAKIQAMIENKIPPQKGQALKAWMRISMLGNLKTIGTRNPLGNIALRPVNDVGDFFGSMADYAISKITKVRTKGNFNVKAQVEGIVKGGSESIQDAKMGINTRNAKGNKLEIGEGKSFNEQHKGVTKILNPFAKAGNKADSTVSFLLDIGDRPFYEATYEQSLQNQMKLNGIKNREDVTDWMKSIAEQEALERTYQDDNGYTKAVLDIRNAMNTFNFKGYGLGDVLIPFAKTPANITKAIVDYSPAGFVNAITKGNELKTAIKNGQFTPEMQHAFVNQLGKATAGTILYALGTALVKSGITTGGADEDKDVADFMRNTLGIQPYSIKVGDKTFTYDWAQPIASGLAIPADIDKGIKDAKDGEVDLEYIIHQAFSTAGSVLLEQSFLQGIKDVLGGYGDPIDNLMSEIEGLPARAIPTFLQQIITFADSTKRMSYGNKGIDNAIAQAQAKTPWAKDLPVYRNSMGKEIKMYGGKNNLFNVFLNPANYSEGNASESAKEIYKVYQSTNDKTILPRLVDNNMKNEDGTKLTNQQKSDFLKISGNIIEKNVDGLRANNEYNNMSDEDKAQAIKSIVDYAYNKARKDITGHELSSAYKKAEKAEKSGYAIADYYISKQANKTSKQTSTSDRNRYQELADKGIDGRTFDDFKAFVSTAKGESRTGGLTKKQKIINYIENLPIEQYAKQNLYDDYLENSGMFQYYK